MAEKLIPLEDAQAIVLSHVNRTEVVEIPVWQAAGLPLAEDAVADILRNAGTRFDPQIAKIFVEKVLVS